MIACEYGAQAAAVHGALTGGAQSSPGMLASLSDVKLHRAQFPADAAQLRVQARMRSRSDNACLYAFEVHADGVALAEGQVMIALRTAEAV